MAQPIARAARAPSRSAAIVAALACLAVGACSRGTGAGTPAPAAPAAKLVEELSIGAETGAEAHLFGSISGAWATDDRLYVIDRQIPAVRAYDRGGSHLLDIGRPGQGPGEYGEPAAIAVRADGSVAIADSLGARVNIYAPDGELIEDRRLARQKSALGLVLSYDDQLFTEAWDIERERLGIQAIGSNGLAGAIRFPPPNEYEPPAVAAGKGLVMVVPFAASYAWAFTPGGEIVSGVGDDYRFRVERADGRVQVVERDVARTPVSGEEAAYRAQLASESLRGMDAKARFDPAAIPTHKPAYQGFFADRARRVWVVRPGPGRPDPTCLSAETSARPNFSMRLASGDEVAVAVKSTARASNLPDPDLAERECWDDSYSFDLFDLSSGELVATIEAPEAGFHRPLFADEDTVLAAVMDDAGTVRLKVYRLELD